MGVASSFDGLVEPTVYVVGGGMEIDGLVPSGTRVIHLVDGAPEPEPTAIALLVLDARTRPLDALADTRHSLRFATVPALVLACDDQYTSLEAIGADDILTIPFDRSVSRRILTLIELGRTRFALWFAQQALEHSVSGLTIGDRALAKTPLVHVTTVFEKITGYSPAEARGRDCRFLQGIGTDPAARRRLREAIQQQRRAQVTVLNYKKDGTPFWNEVTVFPVRTPDGQPLRWIGGVQHDVTSLIEARAEVDRLFTLLLLRETFDQAILNGVDVGIITTDADGRATFVNRCAREVLHRDGELDGEDVRGLLRLTHGPNALLGSQSERRWAHSLVVEGREVEIDLAVSRAHQAHQEHLGFFLIFHDRTHEKQLEMDRRRFERLAAMGTMVAGFAHEVRNPMASLRSIAESLNEELVEANVRLPHVDRMLQVLERVERLVRTLLVFGRPAPPRPAAHRPWTLLSAAVTSLEPRTRTEGDLGIEAEPDLPDVFIDDGQMIQVLVILLNNAIDATGSPRRVLLRAREEALTGEPRPRNDVVAGRTVRFEVRDDGPGIPQDIMERIFDPFFTTKSSGTGLGLSIAQQLVTENGSRIELRSAVGGPTTFSVVVPVATRDAEPLSRR